MDNENAIIWLGSLKQVIGKSEFESLWNFEQPLTEIIEMLKLTMCAKDTKAVKDIHYEVFPIGRTTPIIVEADAVKWCEEEPITIDFSKDGKWQSSFLASGIAGYREVED